jgi:crotonobetainyl-CoA:carnitine CoA-transferase CaiB-like acyl-CoA transferase
MTAISPAAGVSDRGAVSRPLDGLVATSNDASVAADVALRQLQALGCAAVRGAPPAEACREAGAGSLSLRWRSAGRGARAAVDTSIGWAGPVAMPLEDETTVQAACGVMEVHGRQSGTPTSLAVDYASTAAGVIASQGVLAALIARARGADMPRVKTSVAQAALLAISQYLACETCDDAWVPPTEGSGASPFVSADDVWFEIEALDEGAWRQFWMLAGTHEKAVRRGWPPFLYRYTTATCALPEELPRAAARHRYADVSAMAQAAGVTVMPLHSPCGDGRAQPGGNTRSPCQLTALPTTAPPPSRDRPPAAGLPLEGLVVVDVGRRVQGPLAAHVLGLLGARVVRVEPLGGDPARAMPPMAGSCSARFLALNRGKEVVEIDLKSDRGRRVLKDLVAEADVVLHNSTPGRATDLGLDADELVAVRPGLVYAWAGGWGDATGPRHPIATDFVVQAYSGLASMVRPEDESPAPSLMTIVDVLGGLVSAEGVLAGLLAAARSQQAQRVHSSLLSAAALLAGRVPRGRRARWGPLHRPLPTSNGYLALSARARARPVTVAGLCGVAAAGGGASRGELAARFRTEPSEVWVERLSAAGLGAVPVCTDLKALASDPAFAPALRRDGYVSARSPWEFTA